jgi:hypothetical protein
MTMTDLLFGETVVRLRAARVTDPYSQTSTRLDWSSPAELAIAGCVVYQADAGEQLDVGRDQVTQHLTVLLPPGTDLTAADRLRVRGLVYDVDGPPFEYRSPLTGWVPGMQVSVTRREG